MRIDYEHWLASNFQSGTVSTQMSLLRRIEQAYGNIDEIFEEGQVDEVLSSLRYSREDERRNQPNPSKLEIGGNLYNNLASFKAAISYYRRFLEQADIHISSAIHAPAGQDILRHENENEIEISVPEERTRLALERDMQQWLRNNISDVRPDLRIADGGFERRVESGFIDIVCEDASDGLVVIELKAGRADGRVIAQILGYMGDLAEEESVSVSGIIIAHEFDRRTTSAAKILPQIKLMRYDISFSFLDA